jgi:hypothetical protein
VASLSADGAHIRTTMVLQVGEQISLAVRDGDGPVCTLEGVVADVRARDLLDDEADVRFSKLDDATRERLSQLVQLLGPDGGESDFQSQDEDVTQRRSVSDLAGAANLADLDPPTVRKKRGE